jgi:GNAT superfamily N-acetyltransferase
MRQDIQVHIRPAEASDAGFLARIEFLAGRSHLARGVWEIALNAGEDECLAYLEKLTLAQPRSFFHYSHFLVAQIDESPASALCGYDPGQAGYPSLQQAMAKVARELNWTESDSKAIWHRIAPYGTCMFDESPGTWVVENVATLPRYRKRGLINALLKRMLEMGRERGYLVAQVSMDIGNSLARQAYEKVGFRLVGEKRHADYERLSGAPGRWLLTCDL